MGSAFEGYLLTKLRRWESILLAISGLCVFTPNIITRGLGLAFQALFLLTQIVRAKRSNDFKAGDARKKISFSK